MFSTGLLPFLNQNLIHKGGSLLEIFEIYSEIQADAVFIEKDILLNHSNLIAEIKTVSLEMNFKIILESSAMEAYSQQVYGAVITPEENLQKAKELLGTGKIIGTKIDSLDLLTNLSEEKVDFIIFESSENIQKVDPKFTKVIQTCLCPVIFSGPIDQSDDVTLIKNHGFYGFTSNNLFYEPEQFEHLVHKYQFLWDVNH